MRSCVGVFCPSNAVPALLVCRIQGRILSLQESVAENKVLAGVSCLGAFHFLIIADVSLC